MLNLKVIAAYIKEIETSLIGLFLPEGAVERALQ